MSATTKAQRIVNELEEKFGFMALGYQNTELEIIKDLLEEFLEQGIETEDLEDPEDCEVDLDEVEDDEENSDED